jgi:hypothetical protein
VTSGDARCDIYRSPQALGRAFVSFVNYNQDVYKCIHREDPAFEGGWRDCGWMDGGCWSLAEALKEWLVDAQIWVVFAKYTDRNIRPEHLFVRMGRWFIDADGIVTLRTFTKRWQLYLLTPA